jgi:CRP-like cAMP-binding protein
MKRAAVGKSSSGQQAGSQASNGTIRQRREDPLAYLPQKRVQEYPRQQVIYSADRPCDRLYMVTLGHVTVSGMAADGRQVITRIVGQGGLFGESALVEPANSGESAVALDQTGLMAWTRAEVESLIESNPRLGLALAQHLAQRCVDLNTRIENHVIYNTPERTALALIELANALGTPMVDGAVRIPHLTHATLAQYIGTSREIVTSQMTQLRKLRLLKYNHRFADVYVGALEELLRARGVIVLEPDGLSRATGQVTA